MNQAGSLVDRYILGARVAPVVVVAFPLFLAVSAWIPFSQWPIKLFGGSVFLAIGAFVVAQIARDAGKAIEAQLWAAWGGAPSVRMLRHRDATIARPAKQLIHRHLVELGVVDRLPSEEEERQDPDHAEERYWACSDWLRRRALELKSKSPFDVVHSENISYGFRRNLLGIRSYGLVVAGTALAVTIGAFCTGRRPIIELVLTLSVGMYLLLGVTAEAVKRAADEYAKRLLDAAPSIPLTSKAPKTKKSRKPEGQGGDR